MTIKQLADELAVSKSTIGRAIVQLGFQDQLCKIGNKYMLSETQILQIKLQLSKDEEEKSLQANSKTLHEEEKSLQASSKTLHEEEKSLQADSKTLHEEEKSLQANSKTLHEEEKSLQANSKTLHEEEKSLQANSKTLQEEEKSLQANSKTLHGEEKSLQANQEMQKAILQEQLSILNKQLAIKDHQIQILQEQIGQLTVTMESMATALNAAQALHAGTIQKQLTEHSDSMEQMPDQEQPKQKKGIFSRLFGRKEN